MYCIPYGICPPVCPVATWPKAKSCRNEIDVKIVCVTCNFRTSFDGKMLEDRRSECQPDAVVRL